MLAHHSKRLVQRDILEILRKYTDKDHTMSQQAIQKKLAEDYEIVSRPQDRAPPFVGSAGGGQ